MSADKAPTAQAPGEGTGGKPCTCSQQGVYCRGAANLGAGWYCERAAPAAQQAPSLDSPEYRASVHERLWNCGPQAAQQAPAVQPCQHLRLLEMMPPKCADCGKVMAAPAQQAPAGKLDGLGAPVVGSALYYVQDSRQYVGNCVSWWGPDGRGYTCELSKAGKYFGFDVSERETDIPWPVAHVEARVVRHVRGDHLRRLDAPQPAQQAPAPAAEPPVRRCNYDAGGKCRACRGSAVVAPDEIGRACPGMRYDRDEALDMLRAGATVEAAAEKVGRSAATVRAWQGEAPAEQQAPDYSDPNYYTLSPAVRAAMEPAQQAPAPAAVPAMTDARLAEIDAAMEVSGGPCAMSKQEPTMSDITAAEVPCAQDAAPPEAHAEPLTLEGLVRSAVQVAILKHDSLDGGHDCIDCEGRAVVRALVLSGSPAARLALAAELIQGLPHGRHLGVHVALRESAEARALVLSLGGEARTYILDGGEAHDDARVQLGIVEVSAHTARPATPEEQEQLRAAPPRQETCVVARRNPGQAGVVLPELAAGLGLLSLLGALAFALHVGALWVVALLGGVSVAALYLSPLVDLAPRPSRRRPLPVQPMQRPGGGRVRRQMPVTVAPLRHRAPGQKGHMIGTTAGLSAALVGGGILLCSLLAGGCDAVEGRRDPAPEQRCRTSALNLLADEIAYRLVHAEEHRAAHYTSENIDAAVVINLRAAYRKIEQEGCGL